MRELTEHQEELGSKLTRLRYRFTLEMTKPGITQRQAYLAAGGSAKNPSAQDGCASDMWKEPKVQAFYNSLIETEVVAAIFTREEALGIVADIAKNSEASDSHRVAAVGQASKMQGWDAPKKQQITGADDGPIGISCEVSSADVSKALTDLVGKL